MKSYSESRGRQRRIVIVGAGLVVALAGAYGLRSMFVRPGESSLRFVPADAAVVISINLTPGPSQVIAFNSISQSLKRHGYDQSAEDTILNAFGGGAMFKELRPLLKGGGVAYMEVPGKGAQQGMPGLCALALNDSAKATEVLKSHGPVMFYKGVAYVKAGPVLMSVVDDQLLVSDNPVHFAEARQAHDGEIPSILTVAEFAEARKDVASDANLLVYVSGKALAAIPHGKVGVMPEWSSVGLSVRDNGLDMTFASKSDLTKNPQAKTFASMPPLRSDLFDVLPSGSYGIWAVSDPAATVRMSAETLKSDPNFGKEAQTQIDKFVKSTGLSVEDDIVRATQGNGVVAVYPSDQAGVKGVDVLLVMDDQNGADPASEFRKYEAYAEKQITKDGQPVFVRKPIEGGEEYALNDQTTKDIYKSIHQNSDRAPSTPNELIDGKTLVVGLVGKTAFAASSQALLDRAMASYRSKTGSLSSDPAYAPYVASAIDGSQSLGIVSLSRIAEAIRNSMKPDSGAPNPFDSVLNVIQQMKQPLTIKGKVSPDGLGTGSAFIPLDYAALIDGLAKSTAPQKRVVPVS